MTLSAFDVAAYIVDQLPLMTTMKLHRLVYYSYAEYANQTGSPLFYEDIQAWMSGTVIPELFAAHKGEIFARRDLFGVADLPKFSEGQITAINTVINKYGELTAGEISWRTRNEPAWIKARRGFGERDKSTVVIPLESIIEGYSQKPR